MFYRQSPKILNTKPLQQREPWWWEIAALRAKHWLFQIYEWLIAFMVMIHVNFWCKESYHGEYASQCSFSTNELRGQCLMREASKLLAVYSHPAAVKHRQETLEMYANEKQRLESKVQTYWTTTLCRLFPHSLFAHECRLAGHKIKFFTELIHNLQNTPLRQAEAQLASLHIRIEEIKKSIEEHFQGLSQTRNHFHHQQLSVLRQECDRLTEQKNKLFEELALEDDCTAQPWEKYSHRMERAYSSNIDPWYYEEKARWNHLSEMQFIQQDRRDLVAHDGKVWKKAAQELIHPDLQKWLARKMTYCYRGTEVEGEVHLVMWFNPLKFGFMYSTNLERTIDARILQAAAAKYVLTYRCVDFFVDDIYFKFFPLTSHAEMRKYFQQEERQFQKKKRVRQPDGEFVWMLEDNWMADLLRRQGFQDPSKYKLLQYFEDSELAELTATTQYNEEGALVAMTAAPATQEEIDEEYMSRCAVVERAPDNPNSVAKTGKRVQELKKKVPQFEKQIRLRFERAVQSEDLPIELSLQRADNHIPYFTNKEFETYALLYHGPGSDRPVNENGRLLLQTDPQLVGLANSQLMIEFCYEKATPSTIRDIGMQRLEDAKKEAKQLCLETGRDEDDYGGYVRQIRIDEHARVNSEAVEKLRITNDLNLLIQQGADSTQLLLQLDALPATVPIHQLLLTGAGAGAEGNNGLGLDPGLQLLLENGQRDSSSSFLESNGYFRIESEEKKQELEDRLIEIRHECVTRRLNEVNNTAYFCEQVQQNIRMMQSGKYIDKRKEAQRFQRTAQSNTFTNQPLAMLTYADYISSAENRERERQHALLIGMQHEDEETDEESMSSVSEN